jgi:sphingolipid delta-4 desaturase
VCALTANIPMVVPAAMSFCKYHLIHHRHLGEPEFDADLAGPTEARLIGRSTLFKTGWLAMMALVLGVVRPNRLKRIPVIDRWTLVNVATQLVAIGVFVWFAGPAPLKYLVASTILAVGLHPLGARWIQEHYVFSEGQETYSYYGPLNKVAFNAGYHNEHHDLMTIPWVRLPRVRSSAPEFYEELYAHYSWSRLLIAFLSQRDTTLYSRIVRRDSPRL